MCRFVLYVGPEITISSLVTEPQHSLIHQSHHARERREPLNGDGFGIAWYLPDKQAPPGLFRSVTPAWNNQNLRELARVLRSRCILAHVRAATVGSVMEANCHPFVYRGLSFMHNGEIAGFDRVRRTLRRELSDEAYAWIHGTTDSEHLFALFIDAWNRLDHLRGAARLAEAATEAIRRVEELCAEAGVPAASMLNLVASDGRNAAIARYASGDLAPNSLHLLSGAAYECRDGLHRMQSGDERAVLVASEPLSGEHEWRNVRPNAMLTIDDRIQLHEHPIEVS